MPKSPPEMLDAIAANVAKRTGKSVEGWARLTQKAGPKTRKERVEWLMGEHRLGHVATRMIADRLETAPTYSEPDALMNALFAGPKAALRPLYDEVAAAAHSLGPDVEQVIARTQVTFRRNRQFAWVKPNTNTRLDLGLAVPGIEGGGPLLPVAGTNDKDRVRLRIALSPGQAVDAEAKRWLKTAYDLDAK